MQARIPRVVVGAMNKKAGCAGSILNLFQVEAFNHQVEFVHGILEQECSKLLSEFFRNLRVRSKRADMLTDSSCENTGNNKG